MEAVNGSQFKNNINNDTRVTRNRGVPPVVWTENHQLLPNHKSQPFSASLKSQPKYQNAEKAKIKQEILEDNVIEWRTDVTCAKNVTNLEGRNSECFNKVENEDTVKKVRIEFTPS